MQKSSTENKRSLLFTDLVPGIHTLYSSDEILNQGRRNFYAGEGYQTPGEREMLFDCRGLLNSEAVELKERDHYLSWCFFRCIELAKDLGIESLSVSCPPEYWNSLEGLWSAAADLIPGLKQTENIT